MAEKQKPKLAVYLKSKPRDDVSIVEIDGAVGRMREKLVGVFDHHRTGKKVNLDEVPEHVDEEILNADQYATHSFDVDYLISAVVTRMGGKANVDPESLKILYSASEWCDLLESDETDPDIKNKALGLFFYFQKKESDLISQFCEKNGEKTPQGIDNPSDETESEIANIMADELEDAIRNGALDKLQDFEYLKQKEPMQSRWKEANKGRRNDDLMAVVVLNESEYIDPLFAYELVNGKILITANENGERDGKKLHYYTIGLKPSAYKELDLRALIDEMNDKDPSVIRQKEAGIPQEKQSRWGGRAKVFGSPLNGVYSELSPDEVEKLVEENLDKCALVEGLS